MNNHESAIKEIKRIIADAVKEGRDYAKNEHEADVRHIKRLKIEVMNSRERARLELEEKIEQSNEKNYSLVLETDRLKTTIYLRDEEIKQLKDEMAGKCCGNCEYRLCSHWKKKETIDVRCANCVDRYKINPVPTRCKDCLGPTGELKYPYFRPKKKE